jgi:hypothetical protein
MRFIAISIFILLMLTNICSISNASDSFPTDRGNYCISGGFSYRITNKRNDYFFDEKEYNLTISANHFIVMDISLGLFTKYKKTSSGKQYYAKWAIGPQITFYPGGQKYRPGLTSDPIAYLGLGILSHRGSRSFLTHDGEGNYYYLKESDNTFGLRAFLGFLYLFNKHVGLTGEVSLVTLGLIWFIY